jgi:hypothetical protein
VSDVPYDDADFDTDLGDIEAPLLASSYYNQEAELILLRLREIIEAARPVPLSASAMIAKEEVLDLLDDAISRLPEELRAARWLLKEREDFLARTQREGDEMVAQARARAEQMVQRTEVVKAAEARAYQLLDSAETDARRLRHEVEDFCDQKLASFEIVLDRTLTMVASGRAKLQGTNLTADVPADPFGGHPVDDFEHLPPPPGSELFDDADGPAAG